MVISVRERERQKESVSLFRGFIVNYERTTKNLFNISNSL